MRKAQPSARCQRRYVQSPERAFGDLFFCDAPRSFKITQNGHVACCVVMDLI